MSDDDRMSNPRDWVDEVEGGSGCYKCHMCGLESDYPLNNHDCPCKGSYEAELRLERKIREENS